MNSNDNDAVDGLHDDSREGAHASVRVDGTSDDRVSWSLGRLWDDVRGVFYWSRVGVHASGSDADSRYLLIDPAIIPDASTRNHSGRLIPTGGLLSPHGLLTALMPGHYSYHPDTDHTINGVVRIKMRSVMLAVLLIVITVITGSTISAARGRDKSIIVSDHVRTASSVTEPSRGASRDAIDSSVWSASYKNFQKEWMTEYGYTVSTWSMAEDADKMAVTLDKIASDQSKAIDYKKQIRDYLDGHSDDNSDSKYSPETWSVWSDAVKTASALVNADSMDTDALGKALDGLKSARDGLRKTIIVQDQSSSTEVSGVTVPVGEMQQWAHDYMMDNGYSEEDFTATVFIINHESGWNVHSTNASSGAYGLPQSLPAGKMASAGADWHDNYQTQLRWFWSYCNGRYGSVQGAYKFWVSNRWY